MTGPEHYQKAERLLEEADLVIDIKSDRYAGTDGLKEYHRLVATAQVHAQLAVVAVQVDIADGTAQSYVSFGIQYATSWTKAVSA